MKLVSKIPFQIVFPILILWQVLLTFQGLDLADTGFHLTAYRFIFEDPYAVQYSMMFWLSDVCGALWMALWPRGGLHWIKLGWVAVMSTTFLVYYSLLHPRLGNRHATMGLAITLVFILQGGPETLNYDVFSALAYALGIFSLYNGLLKDKLWLLLVSGFIFGAGVFFKLSNLSALAFLLLVPFVGFLKKDTFGRILKLSILWVTGFGIGMLAILFLIQRVGHFDLFLENLSVVAAMGNDIHASHGLKPMLLSYLSGYVNALVIVLVFLAGAWAYIQSSNKYQGFFTSRVHTILLILVAVLAVILTIVLEDVFWSKVRYLFIGLMILKGIFMTAGSKCSLEIRLLALSGLILLLIAPLGSDSGLGKSIWGMWILGPMLLVMPLEGKLKGVIISLQQARFLRRTLALVVLLAAMVHAWQSTYFDAGSRSRKIHAIEHPLMKHIYTSRERADVVNELISNAFPLIEKEEYLLSFIEIPMLNYLSDKKPFISTSWPKLYYNPQTFQLKLEEALQKRKTLPAIIRQKQNTMVNLWPVAADPNYLNYPVGLSKWPEHGKILNEFIIRNNYQVVWENEMFQLLTHE